MEVEPNIRLSTGDEMPRIGLGTWQVRPEDARRAVRDAIAVGYRHIDTARVYGNEVAVGEGVRDSGVPRKDLWITTKVFNNDQGYEGTLKACRESVRRLGMDYVDLFLIHWPVPEKRLDTWRAMVKLQQDGFCRAIGVSNYLVSHLEELTRHSDVLPHVHQLEVHPFLQQRPTRAWCDKHGVVVQAYSPLTRGERLGHRVVVETARELGRTPAQVLLRWGLEKGMVVLPKSSRKERIAENFAALDFELGADDLLRLDDLEEALHTSWDPTDVP